MTYWIATVILAVLLLASSWTYLFHESTIEGVRALGFPDFFRIQLAILKPIAAIVIVVPQIPTRIKEWAYAGIALFLLTAIVAHIANKDPWVITVVNCLFLVLLFVSYSQMETIGQ